MLLTISQTIKILLRDKKLVDNSEMFYWQQMKILNDVFDERIIKPLNEEFDKKYEKNNL